MFQIVAHFFIRFFHPLVHYDSVVFWIIRFFATNKSNTTSTGSRYHLIYTSSPAYGVTVWHIYSHILMNSDHIFDHFVKFIQISELLQFLWQCRVQQNLKSKFIHTNSIRTQSVYTYTYVYVCNFHVTWLRLFAYTNEMECYIKYSKHAITMKWKNQIFLICMLSNWNISFHYEIYCIDIFYSRVSIDKFRIF